MDPSSIEPAGIQQPAPVEQPGPGGPGAPAAVPPSPVVAQPPMAVGATIPLPPSNSQPPADSPSTANPPAAQAGSLVADDDGDLIEKEWVDKAKRIVEQTRNDPYKQSEELTLFKADYLKKRYGKTIKVSR